jgi:hypothetical protein
VRLTSRSSDNLTRHRQEASSQFRQVAEEHRLHFHAARVTDVRGGDAPWPACFVDTIIAPARRPPRFSTSSSKGLPVHQIRSGLARDDEEAVTVNKRNVKFSVNSRLAEVSQCSVAPLR